MTAKNSSRLLIFFWLILLCPLMAISQQSLIPKIRILFESRNFEKAKELLSEIDKSNTEYAESLYYTGRIAVEEKKFHLSVERFEEAIEVNPNSVEYHNWLGVMYGVVAMNSGTLKQAYFAPKIKYEFETAAKLDPENLPTQWGLVTYYCKAPGFLGGSWEKALVCAEVITRHDKIQGKRAFAFIHAAQKKTDLAEKEYVEAMNADPSNCENVFALGQFYKEQKKYDMALRLYEGVISRNPRNMVASFHLGQASAESGLQTERGIACLINYLKYTPKPNEPGHCDANLGLAKIYERKGERVAARKYYQTSLNLYPEMKEAKEGLERLN